MPNISINIIDNTNNTALHHACQLSHDTTALKMLNKYFTKINISLTNSHGYTALQLACKHTLPKVALKILQLFPNDCKVGHTSNEGNDSTIILASKNNLPNIVKHIINNYDFKDSNPHCCNKINEWKNNYCPNTSSLMYLIKNNMFDCFKLYMEKYGKDDDLKFCKTCDIYINEESHNYIDNIANTFYEDSENLNKYSETFMNNCGDKFISDYKCKKCNKKYIYSNDYLNNVTMIFKKKILIDHKQYFKREYYCTCGDTCDENNCIIKMLDEFTCDISQKNKYLSFAFTYDPNGFQHILDNSCYKNDFNFEDKSFPHNIITTLIISNPLKKKKYDLTNYLNYITTNYKTPHHRYESINYKLSNSESLSIEQYTSIPTINRIKHITTDNVFIHCLKNNIPLTHKLIRLFKTNLFKNNISLDNIINIITEKEHIDTILLITELPYFNTLITPTPTNLTKIISTLLTHNRQPTAHRLITTHQNIIPKETLLDYHTRSPTPELTNTLLARNITPPNITLTQAIIYNKPHIARKLLLTNPLTKLPDHTPSLIAHTIKHNNRQLTTQLLPLYPANHKFTEPDILDNLILNNDQLLIKQLLPNLTKITQYTSTLASNNHLTALTITLLDRFKTHNYKTLTESAITNNNTQLLEHILLHHAISPYNLSSFIKKGWTNLISRALTKTPTPNPTKPTTQHIITAINTNQTTLTTILLNHHTPDLPTQTINKLCQFNMCAQLKHLISLTKVTFTDNHITTTIKHNNPTILQLILTHYQPTSSLLINDQSPIDYAHLNNYTSIAIQLAKTGLYKFTKTNKQLTDICDKIKIIKLLDNKSNNFINSIKYILSDTSQSSDFEIVSE